ncbi:MAG: invasion associated locus B family protein [Magnetospiraceae bacterium]
MLIQGNVAPLVSTRGKKTNMKLSKFSNILIVSAVAMMAVFAASGSALAQNIRLLEETSGAWKGSCYKEAASPAPYCRIMAIQLLGDLKKTGNFIQFGPAFDRGNKGFVVATYLGFAPESVVELSVDQGASWSLPTSAENHTIAPGVMTEEILSKMAAGENLTITFKPATGVTQSLSVPLDGYRALLKPVHAVLQPPE